MLSRYMIAVLSAVVLLSSCGREEEKTDTITPVPLRPVKATPTGPSARAMPELKAADEKDDPTYASLFPRSDDLKDIEWVKTEPVRGAEGTELGTVLPDLAGPLALFHPVSVAHAAYQRYRGEELQTVRAWLIRAPGAEDAYGMLTVACPGQDLIKIADVYRSAGPHEVYVLRNDYLGIFKAEVAGEPADPKELTEAMELLAGKTMFNIAGRGGPPGVVQIFQTEKMPPAETFFLRSLRSLDHRKQFLEYLDLRDTGEMSRLLQLGPEVKFALAAFTIENWTGPDVMWIAQYPNREQALAVYSAYRKALRQAPPDRKLYNNTLLMAPQGKYLLGCWTLEAESLVHLMPEIRKHLPEGS